MTPTVLLAIATCFANLVSTIINAYAMMVETRDKSLKPKYDGLLLQLALEQKGRERDRQGWEREKEVMVRDFQRIQDAHRLEVRDYQGRIDDLGEERKQHIIMINNLSVDNDRLRDDLAKLQGK